MKLLIDILLKSGEHSIKSILTETSSILLNMKFTEMSQHQKKRFDDIINFHRYDNGGEKLFSIICKNGLEALGLQLWKNSDIWCLPKSTLRDMLIKAHRHKMSKLVISLICTEPTIDDFYGCFNEIDPLTFITSNCLRTVDDHHVNFFLAAFIDAKIIDTNHVSPDTGDTMLSVACQYSLTHTAKYLLNRDDIRCNTVDKIGITPLIWACFNKMEDVAEIMITDIWHKKGKSILHDAVTNKGNTALSISKNNGLNKIVSLFSLIFVVENISVLEDEKEISGNFTIVPSEEQSEDKKENSSVVSPYEDIIPKFIMSSCEKSIINEKPMTLIYQYPMIPKVVKEKLDSSVEEQQDVTIEEKKNMHIEEQKNIPVEEQKDVIIEEQKDMIVEEQKNVIVEEQKDVIVEEQKDVIVEEQKDVIVEEQKDVIVEEQKDVIGEEQTIVPIVTLVEDQTVTLVEKQTITGSLTATNENKEELTNDDLISPIDYENVSKVINFLLAQI